MASYIRRRKFLATLGGAVAAWPLAARAQQPAMPVIGFLHSEAPGRYTSPILRAFRQGLSESGHVEGRNVAIEYRWAESRYDRLPDLAGDLIGRGVNVIIANGPAIQAAKTATTTIPIVFFAGGDPIKLGLVTSLAQPGGNLTGVSNLGTELGPKRLELLYELVPAATSFAVLVNPTYPDAVAQSEAAQAAARARAAAEKAEPQVDPRHALRLAVQENKELLRRRTDLEQALPRAERAVFAAKAAVENAKQALEAAQRQAGSHHAAAAMGKTSKAALPSIANARRALESAQDELEAATAANADLQAQHADVKHSLAFVNLQRHIEAVVRADPATKALLEKYERDRRQLGELRQAVELVLGYFPHQERLSVLAERFNAWPPPPPSKRRLEWEAAIAALQENAAVELPT